MNLKSNEVTFRPTPYWESIFLPAWFVAMALAAYFAAGRNDHTYALFCSQLTGLIVLLFSMPRGDTRRPLWGSLTTLGLWHFRWVGFASVAILYILGSVYRRFFGVPIEPFLHEISQLSGVLHWAEILFTTLIVAPIAEELLFRGLLFGVLRRQNTKLSTCLAIFGSAIVFMGTHWQYQQGSTLISLFILALLLGIARTASNGLLLPILMHVEAAALAYVLEVFPAR